MALIFERELISTYDRLEHENLYQICEFRNYPDAYLSKTTNLRLAHTTSDKDINTQIHAHTMPTQERKRENDRERESARVREQRHKREKGSKTGTEGGCIGSRDRGRMQREQDRCRGSKTDAEGARQMQREQDRCRGSKTDA